MREKNLNFDLRIERRGTDSLKYDCAKRRGMPEDVLPLWVADMDFKTSSLVLDELKKKVEHGIFGYTETGGSYFEALAGWMKDRHDMDTEPSWLVKTPGVVFALAMAVKAYTNAGDAVLIQQPVYYPFTEVIKDNGRIPVSSDLIQEKDGKYRMDPDDIERKIEKYGIRLFLFCSPHNPVGRVWTLDELRELADICLRHHVIIVSDEIHEDFTFPGYRHIPLLNADERLKEICVTCTSPAKTFNLAGLQISNILIPDRRLRVKFEREISAAGYSQLGTMGIAACEAAYRYGKEWLDGLLGYLEGNLALVRETLKKDIPSLKLTEPEGTYLLWVDFRSLGLDSGQLDDLVTRKAGLWLDSGGIFGKAGEGFERINIATQRSVLREALYKLKAAIDGD